MGRIQTFVALTTSIRGWIQTQTERCSNQLAIHVERKRNGPQSEQKLQQRRTPPEVLNQLMKHGLRLLHFHLLPLIILSLVTFCF